jgi:hypothetical protein
LAGCFPAEPASVSPNESKHNRIGFSVKGLVKSPLVYPEEVHLIQKVFSVEKTAPLQIFQVSFRILA